MRYAFQPLPGLKGRARPVVDLVVGGLDLAPQACLIDTGATDVRLGAHVAGLAGIELGSCSPNDVLLGGLRTTAVGAEVELELDEERSAYSWSATVYFCDPWPWAFGLIGLAGLDPFVLRLDSYEEWAELRPRDSL